MTRHERLSRSPLFDPDWYLQRCPGAVGDPVGHYVESRGRACDPHPLFATSWYLTMYPECGDWRTPLHHFLDVSERTQLSPHPLFDADWYLSQRADPEVVGIAAEAFLTDLGDRDPHPLFSNDYYRAHVHRAIPPSVPPLVHYLTDGSRRGVSPSPFVDLREIDARMPGPSSLDPLSRVLAALSVGDSPALGCTAVAADTARGIDEYWRWEYLVQEQWRWSASFVLYRIIGNDLPPRHTKGQSLRNVRFILENEPPLRGCEKRWVLNRILDKGYLATLRALLQEFDQPFLVIPFEAEEYARIGWRLGDFEHRGVTYGRFPDGLNPRSQAVALDHLYHDKNLYVMNNNGARNAALADGRDRATWVLPFDGNCFFTEEAWEEFREDVLAAPHLRYFTVPMARVTDNAMLREPGYLPVADEEPQLAFRWDADEVFNPDARYGRRPKVDLFYRLGIPGPWDDWMFHPWEAPRPEPSEESGRWARAGWVARLFSGRAELEANIKERGSQRIAAIRNCIDQVDEGLVAASYDRSDLLVLSNLDLDGLQRPTRKFRSVVHDFGERLREAADEAMERPVESVRDKTTLAPSGDPRDYWHPAPYWWPNPETDDGRPYVRRDGERAPGTILGDQGSERFDRTAAQRLFDDVHVLALAGHLLDGPAYHDRAAERVCAWFVDDRTRMSPHLRYAQVRIGHDGDEGQADGVIEFSDIHYFLDAVRLLERSGAFSERHALQSWLQEYFEWLTTSQQGCAEVQSANNHGTWYDVQTASIAAYIGDTRGILDALRRATDRLHGHFDAEGFQPAEGRRSTSLHYHTYNLQAFLILAHIADRVGNDLWNVEVDRRRPLEYATRWLLRYLRKPWPYEQIQAFDYDRLLVLAAHARTGYPDMVARHVERFDPYALRPTMSVHYGLRPFWQAGLAGLMPARRTDRERVTL